MARAWVRWTEYVDQRARSKEVCSKVLRRMQNMKVAGVFDAWSATVCERKRQKAVVSRVVQRLRSVGLLLAFERWVQASAELRQERAAAESTQLPLARLREQRLRSSKIRAHQTRTFCSSFQNLFVELSLFVVFFEVSFVQEMAVVCSVSASFLHVEFWPVLSFLFSLWRQALPQLRIESKSERVTQEKIIKKFIPARSWR